MHFGASWSEACKQLDTILNELSEELKCFKVAFIDAESIPDVAVAYQVTAAPTLVFFKVSCLEFI